MRVFLSYSSHQRDLAERIAVALRSERHEVFFDFTAMGAGDAVHAEIRKAVRRSHVMVFLISPRAVAKDSYARTELGIAEREWGSPAGRVVPVMAEATAMEDVPAFLSEVNIIELGRNVVSEVSYALDRLAQKRRGVVLRWLGTAGGVGLAATGIVAWVIDTGPSETKEESKPDPVDVPKADVTARTLAAEPFPPKIDDGDDGKVPVEPPPAPTWTWNDGRILLQDDLEMPMVKLEGGTFTMGSPKSEVGHDDDERQHEAKVTGFWIAQTEVTQAQWKAVMGTSPSNCDYGCGDEFPVNRVSWEDAVKFTNALSKKLGLAECYSQEGDKWSWGPGCDGIRLPMEAEWEYAARAGTAKAYSFGSSVEDLCSYGNLADAAAKVAHSKWTWATDVCNDDHANLAPVKTFNHNPWRLYDMHGNVWEWVWDWYGDYPKGAVVDHRGPPAGDERVLRGGSFGYDPQFMRSACRGGDPPTNAVVDFGFRCARSVALPKP